MLNRYDKIGDCELFRGGCLDVMPFLPDRCTDMILADLPYGTTACKWDSVIPFEPLWGQYRRLIKPNGAIVLFGSQPFTSALVMSNPCAFKYEWIWQKTRFTGFLQSKYMPMKAHENVLVFCFNGTPTYNPQKTEGHHPTNSARGYGHSPTFGANKMRDYQGGDTTRFPKTVQTWKNERGHHPTQEPVAACEYLIRTYTNEGETVLDNTMGSGTTGVACVNTGRKFMGIERDDTYYDTAMRRIRG
ncbi:MAG: site-specific DNA-methyltransferase [Gallionella sp.]|jgi:site-specific DNA-methyltransferase (adenine-specific)